MGVADKNKLAIERVARFLCVWTGGWTGEVREEAWKRFEYTAKEIVKIVKALE